MSLSWRGKSLTSSTMRISESKSSNRQTGYDWDRTKNDWLRGVRYWLSKKTKKDGTGRPGTHGGKIDAAAGTGR